MVYRVDVGHLTPFLREVDMFRGLMDRHLDRIAALCEDWRFRAGDYLGTPGEPASRLYVIRRGEVTVTIGSNDESVVVRTVKEWEAMPVVVLFEPPLQVTTARAATDGEAFVISRVRLLELCELEPRIGMHVYKAGCAILMSRYYYTLGRLGELADPPVHLDSPWRKGAGV